MKKSVFLAVFLAAVAALAGCVHPSDLNSIAPQIQAAFAA